MSSAAALRRLALAALAAAAALVLPTPAPADLRAAYDLQAGSLTPSFAASFGFTGSFGLTHAGGRYGVPTGTIAPGGSWSVALTVTPRGGDTELLEVDGSTLSLRDGVLEWTERGGTTRGAGPPAPAGVATQIVVSRSETAVRVVRDKAVALQVEEAGTHLDGLWVTDDATRIRLFDHALNEDEARALRPADGQAPGPVGLEYSHGTFEDGATLWAGARGFFALVSDDDGTGPLAFEVGVFDRSALAVAPSLPSPTAIADGNEAIRSRATVPFDLRALEHDGEYRLAGAVTDRMGLRTRFERAIRADLRGPEGLTIEMPDETTDRTPLVGGAGAVGPRDNVAVAVVVCRGETCDADPGDEVAFGGGLIENGRWQSPGLYRWEGERPEPVDVTSLPLGTYTFRVVHSDFVDNVSTADRVVRIVAPARVASPPVTSPPAPPRPPAGDTRPAPPTVSSPGALLTRARQAVLAALMRERLRGWLRDGRVDVPVAVDQPADVVVQVFDGAAPAKVDPKARASARRGRLIATGRRTFGTPGSARLAVRLSSRGRTLLKGRSARRVSVRTIVAQRCGRPVVATERLTLRR